ncbi:MAG: hypothetical protein AABM64_13920 [Pseudomonadota bacterium]
MRAIAIEENLWLFYDGTHAKVGHAIWPAPSISTATVLRTDDEVEAALPKNNFINEMVMVFREDSFDPVTRVRRGRLYKASDLRPEDWKVQAHQAVPEEARYPASRLAKRLYAFYAWPAMRELGNHLGSTLIALGTQDAYTLWRVVDIERVVTGEDLVTLRARSALGILPELNEAAVPSGDRATVSDVLERLARAAYTADAASVAHLARDAAQCCLGSWLAERNQDPKIKHKDLGELVKILEDEHSKSMVSLLARLHSRAKPNEKERFGTRSVHQGDAEFAVSAVGVLLRELGWAV